MKKVKIASVLFVLLSAFSFISCDTEPVDPVLNENNGENPGENPGTGATAVFKADYNGSTHTAQTTTAVLGDDLIQIVGLFGTNGESIAIVVAASPEVGTYPMNDDVLMAYNANEEDDSYFNATNEGYFEITAIDTANKKISGKFSFKGTYDGIGSNTIMFTNGVFTNIPYTGGTGPVTTEDNIFSAKIDGVATDYADDVLGAFVSVNDVDAVVITALGDFKITIQADANADPGTYQFTGNIMEGMPLAKVTVGGVEYNITGGNLTISYNDGERITGSFSFTVKNDAGETIHTVTNGVFDIYY